MFLNLIFVGILSTALVVIVQVEGNVVTRGYEEDNIASIDEQVAPLGTDNVFCLFTYGNWAMPANMQQDVPSAVYAGVSRLPYHRLDFGYFSVELNGNFPTIVPDCGYEVWGSVYLIPVQDLDMVLLKGGIVDNKKVFRFIQTVVEVYSNGNIINVKCNAFQQSPLPEKIIYGLPIPHDRRPSQQIIDMLTESYNDAGLPRKYIDEISQLPTREQDYVATNLSPGSQTQPEEESSEEDDRPHPLVMNPPPYGVPPMEHQVVVQPTPVAVP